MTLFPGHMCPLASDSKVWGSPVLLPPAMLPARSNHFPIVYLAFPSWLQPQHHMALGCMSTLHLLWCFWFSPEHPWCMGTELLHIGLGGTCTNGAWLCAKPIDMIVNRTNNFLPSLSFHFSGDDIEQNISSVQFNRSVVSDSLQPHRLQHAQASLSITNSRINNIDFGR